MKVSTSYGSRAFRIMDASCGIPVPTKAQERRRKTAHISAHMHGKSVCAAVVVVSPSIIHSFTLHLHQQQPAHAPFGPKKCPLTSFACELTSIICTDLPRALKPTSRTMPRRIVRNYRVANATNNQQDKRNQDSVYIRPCIPWRPRIDTRPIATVLGELDEPRAVPRHRSRRCL